MMNRRTATGGLIAAALPMTACTTLRTTLHPDTPAWPEGQHPLTLTVPGVALPMRLWLYLPAGYHASHQAWPLVFFLHGSGERGSDLAQVKVHGPPRHAAAGRAYPFVLVSPQLDAEADWSPADLHALLQWLLPRLRVDVRRVLATGLSRGGRGVWAWAAAHPQDLAGIAPVCGGGRPVTVCQARQVPVRAYHGAEDTVVPLAEQQASVAALLACGGQATLTVYPGVGHDSWTPAYEDTGLVPWLLAQRRSTGAA
jgi:predicted peptidase